MKPRPPVVTILGHVDHGKTTLLDYIRKSRIAEKEHGGITQRIGAYAITVPVKGYTTNRITFIDTPGHEAFSMLRARGATIADIAILLIDAKDSLKPQTIESISHIKSAQIPFVVAINKIDLPDANPSKVKNDLVKHEVIVEDKGGTVPTIEISAKTGSHVSELLELLLLIAADLKLVYDPATPPLAHIIETKKDERGIVVSIIVKDGILRVGDTIYAGESKARVRSMVNDLGDVVTVAQPSMPIEVLGFKTMPAVGMKITSTPQQTLKQEVQPHELKMITMDNLLQKPEDKKLSLIVKADSQGSLDAIINTLGNNPHVKIVMSSVGNINHSDVFLAKTTQSIIIGFSVHLGDEVNEVAKQEKIVIRTYNIIYKLLEELGEVADLLKEKELREKTLKGEAKILATFLIEGENVYGITVTKGKLNLGDNLEVFRGKNLIGKTKLVSLKQRAKAVSEVKKDQEAGIVMNPPLDTNVGDVVQSVL
ncbi:translation initiation factor IF-2 [Candidatus Roizmanbacteria bacterium]|nr:translation initiation factor IF-2 [Candidatus Roizmanbacteria bacterium]